MAEPSPDGVEMISDVLAQGQLVLRPAPAAEALGASTRMLALSLAEPRVLRTPESGRRALEGLHDLVLGAAAAVEAVDRAVRHAHEHGEASGSWPGTEAGGLSLAAAELRQVLPALARSAASVGRLSYTGPRFGTETERTRSLVEELRRHGATVTFDPTAAADYHETDAGGGWLTQFTVPGDPRTYEVATGDIALDLSALPPELGDREVHPALAVAYILGHLDDFVAARVVDPAVGDSGWIPPSALRTRRRPAPPAG